MINEVGGLFKQIFILENYNKREHIKKDKGGSRRAHWVRGLAVKAAQVVHGDSPRGRKREPALWEHVLVSRTNCVQCISE